MQHIQYDKQLKLKLIFGMSTTSLSQPNTSKPKKQENLNGFQDVNILGQGQTRWQIFVCTTHFHLMKNKQVWIFIFLSMQ